jgi:hypothetical protein
LFFFRGCIRHWLERHLPAAPVQSYLCPELATFVLGLLVFGLVLEFPRNATMQDAVSRLYRIRKTVTKMLEDRGYLLTKEESEFTLESFKTRFAFHDLSPNEPPKYRLKSIPC